jgi:hypothetical protein
MPTPAIIERVKQVQAGLAEAQPDPAKVAPSHVDALKQQLDTVMLDPTKVAHYTSLGDKLLFAYVGFQIDHPKLASTMESLANDLAKAGL